MLPVSLTESQITKENVHEENCKLHNSSRKAFPKYGGRVYHSTGPNPNQIKRRKLSPGPQLFLGWGRSVPSCPLSLPPCLPLLASVAGRYVCHRKEKKNSYSALFLPPAKMVFHGLVVPRSKRVSAFRKEFKRWLCMCMATCLETQPGTCKANSSLTDRRGCSLLLQAT